MAIYTGHNEDSSGNLLLSIGNGMTATVESGTTASQAYSKGAYLFFNNKLCKATVAISSGANLVIGTNLAQTNIGTELISHLRSSDAKEFYFDVKDGKYGFYPTSSKIASEFVPFGGSMSVKAENGFRCTSASNTIPSSKDDYVFIALAFQSNNPPSTVSIAVHNATVITQRRIQMAYVPMFAGLYQDTGNGITVNLTPSPYHDSDLIYDWGIYYCIME